MIQPLEVPASKWDLISVDFICVLPRTPKGNYMIWVIMDLLIKYAHFVPVNDTWKHERLVTAYRERACDYTSWFLRVILFQIVIAGSCLILSKKLEETLGRTKLKISTTFHLATDGQTKRTIQTLEDMMRVCALEFHGPFRCPVMSMGRKLFK